MKKIPLSQGKFALVDDEDFEWLSQWKWTYDSSNGYAVRNQNIGKYRYKKVYLHREVVKTPESYYTDHINHDKTDNRRTNLRTCTNAQNIRNRVKKIKLNTTSVYKGVSFREDCKKWVAQITVNYKMRYLGIYNTEVEAARKYNQVALKEFGNFAKLNIL